MLQSQFNLDHRLAELQSTVDEQRLTRQLRDAAEGAARAARASFGTARRPAAAAGRVRSFRIAL